MIFIVCSIILAILTRVWSRAARLSGSPPQCPMLSFPFSLPGRFIICNFANYFSQQGSDAWRCNWWDWVSHILAPKGVLVCSDGVLVLPSSSKPMFKFSLSPLRSSLIHAPKGHKSFSKSLQHDQYKMTIDDHWNSEQILLCPLKGHRNLYQLAPRYYLHVDWERLSDTQVYSWHLATF